MITGVRHSTALVFFIALTTAGCESFALRSNRITLVSRPGELTQPIEPGYHPKPIIRGNGTAESEFRLESHLLKVHLENGDVVSESLILCDTNHYPENGSVSFIVRDYDAGERFSPHFEIGRAKWVIGPITAPVENEKDQVNLQAWLRVEATDGSERFSRLLVEKETGQAFDYRTTREMESGTGRLIAAGPPFSLRVGAAYRVAIRLMAQGPQDPEPSFSIDGELEYGQFAAYLSAPGDVIALPEEQPRSSEVN